MLSQRLPTTAPFVRNYNIVFLGISENERDQISLTIEELEKNYGLPPLPRKPRLRSTSRLETTVSPQTSNWITPTAERPKTPQKRKRQVESKSLTPSQVKSEHKEAHAFPSKAVKLRKRPKTYSKRDVESPRYHYCLLALN